MELWKREGKAGVIALTAKVSVDVSYKQHWETRRQANACALNRTKNLRATFPMKLLGNFSLTSLPLFLKTQKQRSIHHMLLSVCSAQLQLTLHAAVAATSLRRQAAKRETIPSKMLSISLDISCSGLLKHMLGYFTESIVLVLLELIGQGRASNMFETRNSDSMQLVQGILPRDIQVSSPETESSRFSEHKNFKATSSSTRASATTSNHSRLKADDVSADSMVKQDHLFSNEALEKSGLIISNPRGKACSSLSCKGKVILQASEVEQLNARLKILEEENEVWKQAFLETVVERKKLVNEICQLFQTLHHCLHNRDEEDGQQSSHGSLIIKPSKVEHFGAWV